MDWITGMQKAIDYIEANLTEDIDYERVAAESFSSSYHFQRVFSILCGYTLGEYDPHRKILNFQKTSNLFQKTCLYG